METTVTAVLEFKKEQNTKTSKSPFSLEWGSDSTGTVWSGGGSRQHGRCHRSLGFQLCCFVVLWHWECLDSAASERGFYLTIIITRHLSLVTRQLEALYRTGREGGWLTSSLCSKPCAWFRSSLELCDLVLVAASPASSWLPLAIRQNCLSFCVCYSKCFTNSVNICCIYLFSCHRIVFIDLLCYWLGLWEGA